MCGGDLNSFISSDDDAGNGFDGGKKDESVTAPTIGAPSAKVSESSRAIAQGGKRTGGHPKQLVDVAADGYGFKLGGPGRQQRPIALQQRSD